MDRRDFLKISGAVAVAAGLGLESHAKDALAGPDGPDLPYGQDTGGDSLPPGDEALRVRFLGTGAADWHGRDERGERRRFSSILLDDRILIDFTPENKEMLPSGCRPEAVFYTHSHKDHYNPAAALELGVPAVYLGESWINRATGNFRSAASESGRICPPISPLSVGRRVVIGDIGITPLPADHATSDLSEQTLIYLIEKGSVRLLYATDTGGITAVAARLAGIDSHKKDGKGINALIMEATMSDDEDYRLFTHSSIGTVERTVNMLLKTGRYEAPAGRRVYLTHLARTLHGTQAELDRSLPEPLSAAYDGLVVEFV